MLRIPVQVTFFSFNATSSFLCLPIYPKNCFLGQVLGACLLQVGRVDVVFNPDKVLLDAPRRDEAVEDGHAACLVVRTTRTRTAKWLLADDRASALFVVVDVAGCVSQLVRRLQKSLALRCEASG